MLALFDSHCHLDFSVFDIDRANVIARAEGVGVKHFAVPGVTRAQWLTCSQIFRSMPQVTLGFGLHPYFIAEHVPADLMHLCQTLKANPAAFVGEIGLDTTCAFPVLQQQLFSAQLNIAAQYQRPVVLHHRKSLDTMLAVVKNTKGLRGGLVHAFSGSREQAQAWFNQGFKLGMGGVVTYPRAKKTRAVVTALPLEAFVLETDSPDMPLAGYQGQRNEPMRVAEVFRCFVELRQAAFPHETEREIAEALFRNSQSLFC
ncbi:TatD family hydrolase [Aliidiomarina celeris]|uniref:TatD family hydrolase n=1 Tax=Aliidiomarina celeris TaxID=2249428 RepID=UPI000DEAF531|nr:TatD family hydrolase [Aliidiomarina celeris]